jgi:hypothetical protein
MRCSKTRVRLSCLAVITGIAACAAPEDPARFASAPVAAPRIEGDESMAALTAEVRQLRIAIEELGRKQTATQALGITLSAQGDRIVQAAQRLASAREEIDNVGTQSRSLEAALTDLSQRLARSPDRDERAGLERRMRDLGAERDRLELMLQQARSRESESSRALALEEERWNDTLVRMERLTQ